MQVIVSRLRRRIWQPLLLILAVALASPLIFSHLLPPTTPYLWLDAMILSLLVVLTGIILTKRIVAPVVKLATLTEELSPGQVYKYRFSTNEIKKPIQEAVTACGWDYKGVAFGKL